LPSNGAGFRVAEIAANQPGHGPGNGPGHRAGDRLGGDQVDIGVGLTANHLAVEEDDAAGSRCLERLDNPSNGKVADYPTKGQPDHPADHTADNPTPLVVPPKHTEQRQTKCCPDGPGNRAGRNRQ
jgi:hypothetical protein